MKKFICFFVLINFNLLIIPVIAANDVELSKKEKIIVFPFAESTMIETGIGRAVTDVIITKLIEMKRFDVIDRVNIEKIMEGTIG